MRQLALAYADDGVLFNHADDLSRQWEERARARLGERFSLEEFQALATADPEATPETLTRAFETYCKA